MKRIEQALERGAGYCILILTMLSFFANHEQDVITFGLFFLALGLGMMIALAEFIYNMLKINTVVKMILHYSLLLGAFMIIFVAGSGYIKKQAGAAGVFIVIIIYTLVYFTFYGITRLIRSTVSAADKALDAHTAKNQSRGKGKSGQKSEAYTPRFKK